MNVFERFFGQAKKPKLCNGGNPLLKTNAFLFFKGFSAVFTLSFQSALFVALLHFFVVLLKLVSWPKCTWGPGACGAFPQKLCNFSLLKSFCWVLITVQIFWYFSPENGSHKEVNACFFGNFHLLFLNFSMFRPKR